MTSQALVVVESGRSATTLDGGPQSLCGHAPASEEFKVQGCFHVRGPALPRVVGVLLVLGSLSPGLASALAGGDVQSKSQQLCINELNKRFRNVAKSQGREVVACIRDGSRLKLGDMTIEQCMTSDRRGKVARAAAKTRTGAANKCEVEPDFGSTDPNTVNQEAIALMLDLVHELLGPDLDAFIFPIGQTSKCQEALAKRANRCATTMIGEYSRCKRTQLKEQAVTDAEELQAACLGDAGVTGGIPDPKRLLRRSCRGDIRRVVSEKCRGLDLGLILPDSGLVFPFISFLTQQYVAEDVTEPKVDAAIIIVDALDVCGNGLVEFPEECDDGSTANGDGCSGSDTCLIEDGWECSDEPSLCNTMCGDGKIRATEDCDDGNTSSGDGCSDTCVSEDGWECSDEPSLCNTICGDGKIRGTEECDDGNDVECDGCSPECTLEFCGDGVVCALDGDGDGIPDDVDNCPFVANPGQEDDGGLDSVGPDGIGNTCQCGDVNADGTVTSADAIVISDCTQGLPPCAGGGPELLPEPGNCDVNGDGSCNGTDGTLVIRNVMGLTPCASGVGNTNGVCNGATKTEEQLCANAQPGAGAGGGGAFLIEECDDGNQVNEDGCSSECKLEL